MRYSIVVTAMVALALDAGALASQAVQGLVTDETTGKALPRATVSLISPDGGVVDATRSDTLGLYRFELNSGGTYRVRVELLGYRPALSANIRVDGVRTGTLDVGLRALTIVLDTVRGPALPARRRAQAHVDYYARLERGVFAEFITWQEIERWRPTRISEMLAARVSGVTTSPTRGDGNNLLIRGTCSPTLYIDGIRITFVGQTIDDLVRPMEIEGIEVYKSLAGAPAQAQGVNGGCSAILVWTKFGRL